MERFCTCELGFAHLWITSCEFVGLSFYVFLEFCPIRTAADLKARDALVATPAGVNIP